MSFVLFSSKEDDAKLPAELYLELEIAMSMCRKPTFDLLQIEVADEVPGVYTV